MADPILKAVNRLTHAVLMRLADQADGLPEDEQRIGYVVDAAERLADEHRDHMDANVLLAQAQGTIAHLRDEITARNELLAEYQQKFGVL